MAVAMFSNGAYRNVASDAERYKKIIFSIGGMITQFIENISDPPFMGNRLLNLILAMAIIMLPVIPYICCFSVLNAASQMSCLARL